MNTKAISKRLELILTDYAPPMLLKLDYVLIPSECDCPRVGKMQFKTLYFSINLMRIMRLCRY